MCLYAVSLALLYSGVRKEWDNEKTEGHSTMVYLRKMWAALETPVMASRVQKAATELT